MVRGRANGIIMEQMRAEKKRMVEVRGLEREEMKGGEDKEGADELR